MKTIFKIHTIIFLFIIFSYSHTLSQLNSPNLFFPYNNFQGVPIYAGFMWYPVANANSYQIQVSEDSLFNTTVLDENNILINLYYS